MACSYSSLCALRWPTCGDLSHLFTVRLWALLRRAGITSDSRCLKNNQLKSVLWIYHVSLLVRYVEVSLAVEEELGQAAVEVPGPGPGPGVVHRADQSLLASQPPEIIPPGEDTEVIRTWPHGLHKAHPVPHPRQPVDDAEDKALGDCDMRPRTWATIPNEATRVERTSPESGGYCKSL